MNSEMKIPSQVLQECKKGVETRIWSPERTVKSHENGTHTFYDKNYGVRIFFTIFVCQNFETN